MFYNLASSSAVQSITLTDFNCFSLNIDVHVIAGDTYIPNNSTGWN